MVYLYAGLGVVMLSGIMAIFEMGLSLTGQTLLPVPPDDYLSNQSMKDADIMFLKALADEITLWLTTKRSLIWFQKRVCVLHLMRLTVRDGCRFLMVVGRTAVSAAPWSELFPIVSLSARSLISCSPVLLMLEVLNALSSSNDELPCLMLLWVQ